MFVGVAQKKPHDQPECIRMSHAECGSDLLTTVSEHTQQRTDTRKDRRIVMQSKVYETVLRPSVSSDRRTPLLRVCCRGQQ